MISIVIVSHSAKLAEGIKELAGQMAQGRVKIFAAGGLDADTLGTNVETILQALSGADNPDGILVLMDLGSAILSAEAALEFLPLEVGARIRFCAAPLVEGAVAAAVQASLGSDLETVWKEAMRALDPKLEQLGQSAQNQFIETPPPAEPGEGERLILTLANAQGLHARPAARLVQTVAAFDAQVSVTNLTNGKGPVSARSLLRLAALGAEQGHQICIEADGPQAAKVLAAIRTLVEDNFGERSR